jgi:hypothetical protein
MISLADLHRVVAATLAEKRIGQPVFVRYLLHHPEPPESVIARLAQLTAIVKSWLAQPLDRVYVLSSPDRSHVALTLQFQQGATALVLLTHGGQQPGGVDLLVLGNHGAVYHETAGAVGAEVLLAPDPHILTLIERALASGQPERAA